MKIQFHNGDRVVGVGYCAGIDINGMPGTVIMDDADYGNDGVYGVRFDEYNGLFHNLYAGGKDNCEPGHGLWVSCFKLSKDWDLSGSHDDLCELL
jgi:hypothetical protein